jgi:RNA polymerase sigma factor (sigma-70 family)
MQQPDIHEMQDDFYSEFYNRFARTILDFIGQQVATRQDAEDLLLDVFLAALQNTTLSQLPANRQLAWLRRVARNKVIDHYRRTYTRLQPLEHVQEPEDDKLTPEQQVESNERYLHLQYALSHLSISQQELIRLRYSQDLRLKQIADLLERPEGSVRKLLSRTIRQLRGFYEQYEEGIKA